MKNFHYITTTQCLNENPVQARFWIADFGFKKENNFSGFETFEVSSQKVRAVSEKSPSMPLCKRGKQSECLDLLKYYLSSKNGKPYFEVFVQTLYITLNFPAASGINRHFSSL